MVDRMPNIDDYTDEDEYYTNKMLKMLIEFYMDYGFEKCLELIQDYHDLLDSYESDEESSSDEDEESLNESDEENSSDEDDSLSPTNVKDIK